MIQKDCTAGWSLTGGLSTARWWVWQSREAALFRRVDCRTILLGPCKVQALCLWVQRPADVDAPLRDQQGSAGLIATDLEFSTAATMVEGVSKIL